MKQSLQLRLGQTLTMTPQLQQAIRLLQISTLDLQQEIQKALEENPLLERDEESESQDSANQQGENSNDQVDSSNPNQIEVETPYDDVPIETQWSDSDHFESMKPVTAGTSDDAQENFETRTSVAESLSDHLMWQINLLPLTEYDQLIAMVLVDSINPAGFLEPSIQDIVEALKEDLPSIDPDEVRYVLKRIQQLDPVGVGARHLAECLSIQLSQLNSSDDGVSLATTIINLHLDLLEKRDRKGLKRVCGCSDYELDVALNLIRSLDPAPGEKIATEKTEYVVPDLIVQRNGKGWSVELNPEAMPRVSINSTYANMVQRSDTTETGQYLKTQLQEARWFVKSLKSRAETLLKVGTCIVEAQTDFFIHGAIAMKPMVLADIASRVDMHESTISRVTTQKYMHTPRGTLELKYFFSSHVGMDNGGEASSTAIKAHLKELIENEDCKKPLSDAKLAAALAKNGFKVARRTVAKYREILGFHGSSDRRRML